MPKKEKRKNEQKKVGDDTYDKTYSIEFRKKKIVQDIKYLNLARSALNFQERDVLLDYDNNIFCY